MSAMDKIATYMDQLVPVRHDLHRHPEIGFEETRTAGIVADLLRSWGYEVHEKIGGTGVVGVLSNGTGRTIGLRADMDALPMDEETDLPFKSVNPGRFHGCGHDGHTTMLLGAARYLAETRSFHGRVNVIFQPAEEGLGGARAMIADGLFDKHPCDEIYAIHNAPHRPKGQVALRTGATMAAADFFDITLTGQGMHAGMPHMGTDPIVAGAALVQALQTIVSRNVSPVDSAVLSVTQLRAGSAYNVVPDQAIVSGTIRTLNEITRAQARERLQTMSDKLAAAFDCTASIDMRDTFSVLDNHADQVAVVAGVAADLVGTENVNTAMEPTLGSEDFADMLKVVPGAYAFVGQASTGALHNPSYSFDDEIIPLGAGLMAEIAARRCGNG